jgi:superfamily I DNA/RNA helicase
MQTIPMEQVKYSEAHAKREDCTADIINSRSKKIIVVAGPGTGKTYLFKQLAAKKSKCLTLSFVNALVDDLSLDLFGLSKVYTLHGFARYILNKVLDEKAEIFPLLPTVINEDAKILSNYSINFDEYFNNLKDNSEQFEFLCRRQRYYDYYAYSSIIYKALRLLMSKRNRIPAFDQILIDEFQDFNKLEVSFIDLLSENNPLLLVGDDDQALYSMKGASTAFIRRRYAADNTNYESHSLPYCSRCTEVIVEAVNDVIAKATQEGHLKGRINKDYKYYECEEKNRVSHKHPRLCYSHQWAKKIPYFIEEQLKEIATERKETFSVLVIAPTRNQCNDIFEKLAEKGFANLTPIKPKEPETVSIINGLEIISEHKDSNLGWRIVASRLLDPEEFKRLLSETMVEKPNPFVEIVPVEMKKTVLKYRQIIKALHNESNVEEEYLDKLIEVLNMDSLRMKMDALSDVFKIRPSPIRNRGLRNIPITITTRESSKGLSAEYVFMVYCDDQYLIQNQKEIGITDRDICDFLVALSRAKNKVFIVSSQKSRPTFVKWIKEARMEQVP